MKKTWTFDPDEMRDLDFGPALPVLAETLGSSKYGYIAAEDIGPIRWGCGAGGAGHPSNSSPVMRSNAADVLEAPAFISNPRMKAAAPALLKNPEPKARLAAIYILIGPNRSVNPITEILPLMEDSDADVRGLADSIVATSPEVQKLAPQFHKMLTDTNPAVQIAGLQVIKTAGLPISHDELFPFFKIPDQRPLPFQPAISTKEGCNMIYQMSR